MNIKRLCSHLRRDLVEFGQEVCSELEEDLAPSVIKDMLDQLNGLSKRHLDINVMINTDPEIAPIPFNEADPDDGSLRVMNLSVAQDQEETFKTERKSSG